MATTTSVQHTRSMELLVSYQQTQSVHTRNQLVRLHQGLVRKVAHRVYQQCREPYEDLEQIGYLGLIRAIERFNPTTGCAFSSFAVPYIRGEMLHYLRDRGHTVKIPRRWRELQRRGQKVSNSLASQRGWRPNDEEIANNLGVSLAEWQESQLATQNCMPLSLDATITQQDDSAVTLKDILLDEKEQNWQKLQEERQALAIALNRLETKSREAIELVFYQQLSRKQVAKLVGVSPMTMTRRLQKGIGELTNVLQSSLEAPKAQASS